MLTSSACDIPAHSTIRVPCSRPIYIDGCFGWLHTPVDGRSGSVGVLLCAGLKEDKVSAHRSLRLLANATAAAGYPTLRFDYAGAGDSRELDAEEPWTTWQRNVHAAADWLCDHGGVSRIVLCGVRFGAMLASVAAAARDDVAGLVLLAPTLRGRTYIRQITVEAQTGQNSAPAGALTLDGVALSGTTVDAISAVDLRKIAVPHGCLVLIHARENSPVLSECVAAWTARGANVETKDFTTFEAMLRPMYMSHEADAQVSGVVDWLLDRMPADSGRSPVSMSVAPGSLTLERCIETPLRFGLNGHLCGILCCPIDRREDSVAVVIPNSSGAPRYGYGRAGVDLARRLAASGIASLRFDFDGLGDSGAPDGPPTHVFETNRSSDISAAVDTLEQLGFRRFTIYGLCSAAYHALHATLADARISHQVLVNLPLFQWRDGDAIELMGWTTASRFDLLMRSLRKAWLSILRRGSAGHQRERVTRREWFTRRAKAAGSRLAGLSTPKGHYARKCMSRLAPRAKTFFLFSAGEEGIKVLEGAFGAKKEPRGAVIRILSGIDHGLSTGDMRGIVAQRIVDFVECEFGL